MLGVVGTISIRGGRMCYLVVVVVVVVVVDAAAAAAVLALTHR